jgi:hypothetical protein
LTEAPPEQREELRRRLKGRIAQLVTGAWVLIVRQGKKCLCAVQLWFRNEPWHRDYLIFHKPGTRYTEGWWWCRSLATVAKPGDLDLRKPEQARRLEKTLATLDLDVK